ncbi:MAG: glutathione S-transferase family protein [Caulobacteraceae bacterium]|nr:glutathione S-transferase family protein [Caulobacteraceae bacterium]
MALELYYHPLSSYCWKALIALYETGAEFEPILLDLSNPEHDALLRRLWPPRKFPVLRDVARDMVVPESSTIVEYLAQHYPGPTDLCLSGDPDRARQTRLRDRFLDLYIHNSMQKVSDDALRPEGVKDPHGVAAARTAMRTALEALDPQLEDRTWMMGDVFTLADCSAAPALFYSDRIIPMAGFANISAYLERLKARPSFARVLKEAEPWFQYVPF